MDMCPFELNMYQEENEIAISKKEKEKEEGNAFTGRIHLA